MSLQSSIAAHYRGPRPWRPAPLAGLSLALHGAVAIALVVSPGAWPWIIAVVAAATRPFTSVAFAVLAPLWGLGLAGLWAARYGTFPARPTTLDPS